MRSDEYDAFTVELTERVARDERVVGLVAVGSMAQQDYRADEWSDHDFLLVVEPGTQESFRRDLSWLPRDGDIALSFRETEHGLKVLYSSGHLLEFAVFDLEELGLASINRYRVLLDRGGVEARVRELVGRPPRLPAEDFLFGQFVTNVHVAMGRTARGEVLSGQFFLTSAKRHLCALIARSVPSGQASLLDEFDPLRRFERAYPALGAEVAAAGPLELLEIARRELHGELPWAAVEAISPGPEPR